MESFLPEHEATRLYGVGSATLNRFAEAGYLQIETDPDGLKLYSHAQLVKLFGQPIEHPASPEAAPTKSRPAEEPVFATGEVVDPAPEIVDLSLKEEAAPAPQVEEISVEPPAPASPAVTVTSDPTPPSPAVASTSDTLAKQQLEWEVNKLRNIVHLQEKILEMKDREILDLQEQRKWLRDRVTRLEEKGERDQILMLAELKTVRELVSQRKGLLQTISEWFSPKLLPASSTVDAVVQQSVEKPKS